MRKTLLSVAAALLIIASGCSSTENSDLGLETVSVAATVVTLDQSYDEIVSAVGSVQFSETDAKRLAQAKDTVDTVRTTLKEAAHGDLSAALVYLTPGQLQTAYANLRYAYSEVRAVILANRDSYDPLVWNQLLSVNAQLISLDTSVTKLIAAANDASTEAAKAQQWQSALLTAASAARDIAVLVKAFH